MFQSEQKLCYWCQAPLGADGDSNIKICMYCNRSNDLSAYSISEKKKIVRASELRNQACFAEADEIYKKMLIADPVNYKVRWEHLLCKYGVIYIEKDDGSAAYCITCRKALNTEFTKEADYQLVCKLAPSDECAQFIKDGQLISDIQKKIRLGKDVPYDVFICYKETNEAGRRTQDSQHAETIYELLKNQGYTVFFARVSLKNLAGADYEAAIFNAIANAKVMLVIGSRKDYMTGKWVSSEWMRFIDTMAQHPEKRLIPLYRNMSPGKDLPEALRKYEAINMAQDEETAFTLLQDNLALIFNRQKKTVDIRDAKHDKVIEGHQYYAQNMLKEAIACYEEAARAGNPDALYQLGSMYLHGEPEKDTEWAVRCFTEAAEKGHELSIRQLAMMYEFGTAVKANPAKAKEWAGKIV